MPSEIGASRTAIAGFFVSGLLLSFLGAILPAWGYHLRPHYAIAGHYFLALSVGVLLGVRAGRGLLRLRGTGMTLVLGCMIAVAALLALSFTAPPVGELWRIPGLLGIGFAAGLLNTAIFHSVSLAFRLSPASTVNLGGAVFGAGSLIAPLLIAGTFDLYSVPAMMLAVALVPAFFAMLFARRRFPAEPMGRERDGTDDLAGQFSSLSTVLLGLLLFFHFGNEWAIAGWLPLFLIVRLGISPTDALLVLAGYWFALIAGRLAVQLLLPRVPHGRLLLGSVVAALLGCVVLTLTDNLFGAVMGSLLVGFGFAPIYPLVSEKIGLRFPDYHPGLFNGIFSIALLGGTLAPATLGYAGHYLGIRVVMALPALGTFIVLILVLAIWLQAKVTAMLSAKAQRNGLA